MRKSGPFLFGACLTMVVGLLVGWMILDNVAGTADSSSFVGFGLGIMFLYLAGGVFVAAMIVGAICARTLKHPGFATAGYSMTFLILGLAAWLVVRTNLAVAEDTRRRQAHVPEESRPELPEKNEAAKAWAEHERAARDAAPSLLGLWMPIGGKADPSKMHRDASGRWDAVMVSSTQERPEDLMARIAPDGWIEEEYQGIQRWKHPALPRPGDGEPVEIMISRDADQTVWLFLKSPETHDPD